MKTKVKVGHTVAAALMIMATIAAVFLADYAPFEELFPKSGTVDATSAILGMGALIGVPLTLCLFGLTKFNDMFLQLAKILSPAERGRLSAKIDEEYSCCWVISFITIVLQIFSLLYLLFPTYDSPVKLLCCLLNTIICIGIYGIYVCGSVRVAAKFSEGLIDARLTEELEKRTKEEIDRVKIL